jgi:hypothetical protein
MNKLTPKKTNIIKKVLRFFLLKPITILCIKYKYDCTLKQSINLYRLHKQFYN